MEIRETLKDGTELLIRNLSMKDFDKVIKFYRSLPAEDRKYLRIDVTDKNVVEERLRAVESGKTVRIAALHDDEIIATGILELHRDDWRKKQGEIRIIVSKEFQRKRVGMIMIRELYLLAVENKVEKIVARMMRPQIGAQKMLRKLGFREELIIPDYVQDQDKRDQDLVIMICDTNDLWEELEILYGNTDWRRCR